MGIFCVSLGLVVSYFVPFQISATLLSLDYVSKQLGHTIDSLAPTLYDSIVPILAHLMPQLDFLVDGARLD